MRATLKFTRPPILSFLLNKTASGAVFAFQLVVVAVFALIPLIAFRWYRQPFIGAFIGQRMSVAPASPNQPGSWELQRLNLPSGYHLSELDGSPIASLSQLNERLSQSKSGDTVTLGLQNSEGEWISPSIVLQAFPFIDFLIYFVAPYFVGLVYIGISLWIFSLRRSNTSSRAFSILTASMGLYIAGLFDIFTTNVLVTLWTINLMMIGGALINFALLFPHEARFLARMPSLRWIGYLLSAILAILALFTMSRAQYPQIYSMLWRLGYLYACLASVVFLVRIIHLRLTSASPITREQARLILWGVGLSFTPVLIWLSVYISIPGQNYSSLLLLPLAIFPVLTGYAMLRYRLLNTDYLLSKTTLYATLSILSAAGYALTVSGLSLIFSNLLPPDHPLLAGLTVFFLAMLLNPLRSRLQQIVDALFFRNQTDYHERLQAFGRELTQTVDLAAIIRRLRTTVDQSLSPSQIHIFTWEAHSGLYAPEPDGSGKPTTDIYFPPSSVLVQILERRRGSIFLGGTETLPSLLQTERARLALLGVQLFVPLHGQARLIGWLSLGMRRSGAAYSNHDLRYLESLCDQAAMAIERAQGVANLEQRVHEMDILSRIAQGINITPVFDDILELIFAQTNVLIPTRDFRVMLRNPTIQASHYAFYLQNDERLRERENIPLRDGQALEDDVIRLQRALVTDDFEQESRSRGINAHEPDLFAWMGVPLNSGADTIGAISLASRDPSLVYSDHQASLLQAIADQAAGAIVKARLLQESERRARQLATLNEIVKSITSTLDLQPLLNKILVSAADILNCEAGSLLMIDEHTSELIFEVTVGPVAAELIGQRLPPGTGKVGEAVQNRQAIIANDVRHSKGWFDQTDKKTGFVTRDLLVVPMMVHERVIGVIEVINKKDGSPFNQDDQELLATFTSQAAIAVENARLYTQTDQALSARVDELSVMQRIDRELNVSLDLERAMRITLEWAMRQSGADAGLVGLLEEVTEGITEAIRVIASQGYAHGLGLSLEKEGITPGSPSPPVKMASIHQAIKTGQPQLIPQSDFPGDETVEDPSQASLMLLSGAKSQIVVPIRRTSDVIGIILLESVSADAYPDNIIAFLSRLSDHAAIAISNAQLYADLQAANIAKSDFVSLVSHELKTPMTSIRGYADLLAQGAVGPINDVQTNFLNTIRSNVTRMATLVSDLADISRIEAGRMRLEFSSVSLPEVIEETIRTQQGQIDEKKQTLTVQIASDLPAVWGDHNRIVQILVNLLSNATKYTPTGGAITLVAEKIVHSMITNGLSDAVRVSVQDSGFGISPADQKKVFQKFFRSEDENIRESPGTGLGLNITRHLVEMQGGQIWFESAPSQGTTFHFTIPISATESL